MTVQVFVARERELAQLQTFLDRALTGHGQICFVTGEAGAGKTALVAEFARRAQEAHPDLIVAVGQGDAQTGAGDPYLPFREVLGLLTGDVEARLAQGAITHENAGRLQDFLRVSGQALVEYGPDLIDIFVPGGALASRVAGKLAERAGWVARLEALVQRAETPAGQDRGLDQSHIFEQYTNVLKALAAQRPLLLIVDDLQWADGASINLLFRLGRRIEESRILLVGAYRPDDVDLGRVGERHPLEPVLNELKRYFGNVWVDISTGSMHRLEQAGEMEGRQFVEALLDAEPNRLGEGFRQALYQHTEGHPLFTIELLRDLQERGDLVRDAQGCWVAGPTLDWGALPARVEGVIAERIGRLEDELREVLTVASVEGEEFTAEVAARIQALDTRGLVRRLSGELEKRHRLVGTQGIRRLRVQRLSLFRFQHHLFQKYLYNGLSEVERAYLHEDVGNVLETWVYEFAAIEQGGMLQNLALMTQALGLGGFPHFAAHPFVWFQALGFRMEELSFSRTIGAGPLMKGLLKVLRRDIPVPTAVGLERDGAVLIRPFCPPHYRTMEEAVLAFVDYKYAQGTGTFRDGGVATGWKDGAVVQAGIPRYSDEAIAATIAYCEYVYHRYGRFPAKSGPFRTILAHQAHHLDLDFYDRFYRPDALTATQREHMSQWHSDKSDV